MTTHTEEMAEIAEHNQDENPRAPPGDAWPPAGEPDAARDADEFVSYDVPAAAAGWIVRRC